MAAMATDFASDDRPSTLTPQVLPAATSDAVFSDSERERKGPMSWLRNKIQERKDKDVEKRSRTPERSHERNKSRQDLQMVNDENLPIRGKSFEAIRPSMDRGQLHQTAEPAHMTSTHGSEMRDDKALEHEAGRIS